MVDNNDLDNMLGDLEDNTVNLFDGTPAEDEATGNKVEIKQEEDTLIPNDLVQSQEDLTVDYTCSAPSNYAEVNAEFMPEKKPIITKYAVDSGKIIMCNASFDQPSTLIRLDVCIQTSNTESAVFCERPASQGLVEDNYANIQEPDLLNIEEDGTKLIKLSFEEITKDGSTTYSDDVCSENISGDVNTTDIPTDAASDIVTSEKVKDEVIYTKIIRKPKIMDRQVVETHDVIAKNSLEHIYENDCIIRDTNPDEANFMEIIESASSSLKKVYPSECKVDKEVVYTKVASTNVLSSSISQSNSDVEGEDEECIAEVKHTHQPDRSNRLHQEFMASADEPEVDLIENDGEILGSPSIQRSSVVASTHYLTTAVNTSILTESELQLGKIEPIWIDDKDTDHCMLCSAKFTLLLRRHHCRACGRVLCNSCCSEKKVLAFSKDAAKKCRVCGPCVNTLDKIEQLEKDNLTQAAESQSLPVESEDTSADNVIDGLHTSPEVPVVPQTLVARHVKSVLKSKSIDVAPQNDEASGSGVKRSVNFLDGIPPGQGDENEQEECLNSVLGQRKALKKLKAKGSLAARKQRELKVDEESFSLLNKSYYVLIEDYNNMVKVDKETANQLFAAGETLKIAIRRNIHAIIRFKTFEHCNDMKIINLTTKGLYAFGVDEILLVWEVKDEELGNVCVPEKILLMLEYIIEKSVINAEEELEGRNGIKLVNKRMKQFYCLKHFEEEDPNAIKGILLHPVRRHQFYNLDLPETPFFIATFVYNTEVIWAKSVPDRLLYFLGLKTGCYPTPIVNVQSRDFKFKDVVQTTILKVAIDFKHEKYNMTNIKSSKVDLMDNAVTLWLPNYAADIVKSLVGTNRNMIIVGLDFNHDADSHLVCQHNNEGHFTTTIFTRPGHSRNNTGATFIIFDGALKTTNKLIQRSVVEDGVVIRLNSDMMALLVTAMENCRDYEIADELMKVNIKWFSPTDVNGQEEENICDTLVSPIDNLFLGDRYQYGLDYNRLVKSQNLIPSATEWALRLGAIYNIADGKLKPPVSLRIIEMTEMIVSRMALTVAPFISILISNNIDRITFRLRIEPENNVVYTAEKWPFLIDEFAVWNLTVDDQIVPFFYQLVNHAPMGLHVEVHMPIVSTKPMPEFLNEE
uniref:FYVE-type domain-containing protein n=1 Tax=Rhabditophanes sp. KR3021 TaxID=114890 RepID=A0AC35U565_9BILA